VAAATISVKTRRISTMLYISTAYPGAPEKRGLSLFSGPPCF
jgi:hypothetical protein